MCPIVAINIPVLIYIFLSVAVQEHQPTLSMRCRFKRRSHAKFAFMVFTVFVIGVLFGNVFTPLPLDHQDQEDGLPNIVTEASKRNRFLGE